MSNGDDARAMRAGFTMSLITNPACFPGKGGKIPARAGHPQLALHFTNMARAPERLFKDRANPDAPAYPQVETHLVMRVGKHSRKFEQYQENAAFYSDEMTKAREKMRQSLEALQALEAERNAHHSVFPGYAKLAANLETARTRVTELKQTSEERGYLTAAQKEALELREEQVNDLSAKLAELEQINPWSKEEALKEQRRLAKDSEQEVKRQRRELRRDRYQKDFLLAFLRENGVSIQPDSRLFQFMLKRELTLYGLEPNSAPTDRRGIPLAGRTMERPSDEGGTETAFAPCNEELAIPWEHVSKGMSDANGNKLHFAEAEKGKRHFVYTVVAPEDPEKPTQTRHWSRLGTVLVGCWLTDENRGWAVILQRRHWAEVQQNLDLIRATPLIANLLRLWPHPSQERVAKRLTAGASPTVAQGETDDGTADESGDAETPAETGGPAADGSATAN